MGERERVVQEEGCAARVKCVLNWAVEEGEEVGAGGEEEGASGRSDVWVPFVEPFGCGVERARSVEVAAVVPFEASVEDGSERLEVSAPAAGASGGLRG